MLSEMADFRQMNQEFLMEFIQMYRSLPCIWKIKSPEYSDRIKRNKAYEELLTKLKESDKNATVATVKKKIDSLRGTFRKELKKVKESRKSGAGTEEIYKPRLWYFDHLLFLSDQEIPRPGVDNVANNSTDQNSNTQESESEWSQNEQSEHTSAQPFENPTTPSQQSEESIMSPAQSMDSTEQVETPRSNSSSSNVHPRDRPQRMTGKRCRADQVLEKVQKKLDEPQPVEDQFDVVGKNIANKLRALPRETSITLEKCIMDLIYEAHLGNFNKNSKVNIRNERSKSQIPHTVTQPLPSEGIVPLHPTYFAHSHSQDTEASQYDDLRSYVSEYAPQQ